MASEAAASGRVSRPVMSRTSGGRLVQAMCLYRPVFPAALMGLVLVSLMLNVAAHSRHLAFGPPFFWADKRHPCAMMPLRSVPREVRACCVRFAASASVGPHGCVGEMSGAGAAESHTLSLSRIAGTCACGSAFRLWCAGVASGVASSAVPPCSRGSGTRAGLPSSRIAGTGISGADPSCSRESGTRARLS